MANEINYYSEIYEVNGLRYDVVESAEVHKMLQNDVTFCYEYFSKNISSIEVVGVCNEKVQNPSSVEERNFKWDKKTTKLLLTLYNERKNQFRDPKIKKKNIWTEMVNKFSQYGHRVTEDILDRKMRNMKKTFRTIKDNYSKCTTGRGRINWEYYDAFEDLFSQNKTYNIGPTLSSTKCTASPTSSSVALPSSILTGRESPFFESISSITDSDENLFAENECTSRSPIPLLDTVSPSTSHEHTSPHTSQNTSTRNMKSKGLYDIRRQLLYMDNKRLESIDKLRQSIEVSNQQQKESNKIQQDRNEILKKILDKLINKENSSE